jgi:hypothetical protein
MSKKIPVRINGAYAGSFREHPFNWQNELHYWWRAKARPFIAKALFYCFAAFGLSVVAYAAGTYHAPTKVETSMVEVPDASVPPILEKIAKCESASNQYDKQGRLQLHPNKDGSVDVGKYMINNRYWEAKANELGYNIYTPEGNELMAVWLAKNYGSEPWSATRKCFVK